MEKSETFTEVFGALVLAQAKIENPAKDKEVEVYSEKAKYKFKYATLACILDAIRKPLTDNGLWFTQSLLEDEKGHYRLKTTLIHKSGEWLSTDHPLYISGGRSQNQEFGGAMTYMRRYALSSLLGIAADDDEDDTVGDRNGVSHDDPRPPHAPSPIHREIEDLQRAFNEAPDKVTLKAIWDEAHNDGRMDRIKDKLPRIYSKICETYNTISMDFDLAEHTHSEEGEQAETTESPAEDASKIEVEAEAEDPAPDADPNTPPSPPEEVPDIEVLSPETIIERIGLDLLDCKSPGDVAALEAAWRKSVVVLSPSERLKVRRLYDNRTDEFLAEE